MKAGETATTTLGEQFARAIAAKDRARLCSLLADPIDFRALTPQRYWEATSAEEVVDQIILGQWFDSGDHIQELCSVVTGDVGDRPHVAYRMRVRNVDGEFYVEQQAPAPPGGLPAPGKLEPNLPNNHLQYAITWLGLAAVLAGVFAVFARTRYREGRG